MGRAPPGALKQYVTMPHSFFKMSPEGPLPDQICVCVCMCVFEIPAPVVVTEWYSSRYEVKSLFI